MDQYYHHHQPYNQWRQPPPPQQPSLCPVCSIHHFPFCPPYPHPYHHQNPNYSQHHSYARPGFDPYQPPPPPDPAPPPPPPPPHTNGFADPRSWHPNPNSGHEYAMAAAGEFDRSYKRPRIEEIGSGSTWMLTEDERRLKLIRDHGAASFSGFNQENKSLHNNNSNHSNNVNLMPPRSSEMYNIEDSINSCTGYYGNNNYSQPQQIQHKDLVPTVVNHWQGYEQGIGGHLPHPGGNHMAQPPPPLLPASPPPPLPVEAYSSSPSSSFSLFPVGSSSSVTAHSSYPVATEPYYQNKPPPHASGGFRREDPQVIHRSSCVKYAAIPPKQISSDKPKVVDASELFKMPHRASRPDHIVIILRGLPETEF